MYILKCSDGTYYTGSTNNLEYRLMEHLHGEGANYTKKRLPVELIFFEECCRISDAFQREKQIQGWSRRKKEALIRQFPEELKTLAECMNASHCKNYNKNRDFDSAQSPCYKNRDFDSAQSPCDKNRDFDSAQSPYDKNRDFDSAQSPC
ncbi:MAG: GIY-YIG nuclease family protein, partial [Spirochaetia bacterium]